MYYCSNKTNTHLYYETLGKEKQFTLVKGQNYRIGSEQIYQR